MMRRASKPDLGVASRRAPRCWGTGFQMAVCSTTGDPGLHLVASALVGGIMVGRAIQPASIDGGRYTFVLPTLVARARLVSRSARPCELRPWIEDHRRLGVMVSQMMLYREAEREPIPLDHPRLSHGWWDVERDHGVLWRWTDGDAVINLCGEGPTVLEGRGGRRPGLSDWAGLRGRTRAAHRLCRDAFGGRLTSVVGCDSGPA